jgi:glycosyltransferase involved in cell wall biosynthesis
MTRGGIKGVTPRPLFASEADTMLYVDFPEGAVIMPAHNEASVIGRTLRRLAPLAAGGRVEVIVACNGCTDNTADLARSFEGVRVLDVPEASKVAALNAADAAASRWPRLYLDADIEIDPQALRAVFDELGRGAVLAARPAFRYDTEGASGLVRSFYRARERIPSTNKALWGAGAFAVSQEGHKRFRAFPSISPRFSGDDIFIDQQFLPTEKKVLDTPPVMVRTPRRTNALLRVLRTGGVRRFVRDLADCVGTDRNHTQYTKRHRCCRLYSLCGAGKSAPPTVSRLGRCLGEGRKSSLMPIACRSSHERRTGASRRFVETLHQSSDVRA